MEQTFNKITPWISFVLVENYLHVLHIIFCKFISRTKLKQYLFIFTSSLCSQLCDELNEKEKTADGEAKKVKGQCQGHFG